MEVVHIEGYDNLMKEISGKRVVLVGIGPKNCEECDECEKNLLRVLEKYKDKDFKFIRCVMDDTIVEKFNLTSPTLIAFIDGKEVERFIPEQIGMDKSFFEKIERFLKEHL